MGSAIENLVNEASSELATGFIYGIAAGVIIYISIADILIPEFLTPKLKYAKFVLVILGVTILSILTVFLDEEEIEIASSSSTN